MLGEREQIDQVVRNSTLPATNLQQVVALSLLVLAKHVRAESKHGENYTNTQLAAVDTFTPGEVEKFREQAGVMLGQYAVNLAVPRTTEPAGARGWAAVREWFWGFGQGYASAFAWSATLILAAVLASIYAGHELVEILRDLLKPR